MKKKSIELVGLLVVAAFASGTQVAAAGNPIVIGMAGIGMDRPWFRDMAEGAQEAATNLGVKIVVKESGDYLMQASDIKEFVAQGVQGILIVNGFKADTFLKEINAAVKAGVPVATIDHKANTDKVLVHVGQDNVGIGRAAAEFIIAKLGNKGTVIELENKEYDSVADRKLGFDEVIKKSNVKILASENAYANRGLGAHVMGRLMGKYPHFDAVFAANDNMILGAIDAMSAAHIDPASKILVGCDAVPYALQCVKDGKLSATFDMVGRRQGEQAIQILVDYIRNKTHPPQKVILLKAELVTKETLPGG